MSELWRETRDKQSKWGFVSTQLAGVEASAAVSSTVSELLIRLEKMAEGLDLSEDEQRLVLQYASKLHAGHALVSESQGETWGDVVPGEYRIGDTVRVRAEAYSGSLGHRHNGKRGRVIGVRGGDAIVLYDDAPNSEAAFHHDPSVLQRLM